MKKITKEYENRDIIVTGILFVFGVFCFALCYNLFLSPNNMVIGGVTGVAIALQKITGVNSSWFIYIGNLLLLVISFFFLGYKETQKIVIGSLLYPLMITLTAPIATFILPYLQFDEFLVTSLLTGLLYGFSSGLVYKCGYSTGGCDVVVRLLSKYFHIPEGKGTFIIYFIIVLFGGIVFGFTKVIFALIIIYISSIMIDKIMFGISDSKVFYIFTHKSHLVKRTILREFESGFTVLPTKGGYSHQNGMLIMCVLPNREYYRLKKRIIELDPKAFFVITDCYESEGGFKKKNLPFI